MVLPQERECYTWIDYLSWPEGERYELIEGVAYAMSPAPRRQHQEISGALFAHIYNALKGRECKVFAAPFDVKLSDDTHDDAPTVVQPDITITCDRTKLTRQGMTGAPDLVVEIVSPDSGLIDRRRTFDLYERFGVSEYWIVDQDERLVEVYLLYDGTYRRSSVAGPEDELVATAVDDLRITLSEVFSETE